jgi:predicted regulator of Ras-like GTPase activity (Roadblock/LC7/MglB family)
VKDILEPLSKLPGVRSALLVTSDGVPIAADGALAVKQPTPQPRKPAGSSKLGLAAQWGREQGSVEDPDDADEINVLCGLGTGWLYDVARAIAPMSWEAPKYMVLRAVRGTLVIMQAPNAILLVLLEGGMRAEDLRLPMEAAILRMQRVLRGLGRKKKQQESQEPPVGIFPADPSISGAGSYDESVKGVSKAGEA